MAYTQNCEIWHGASLGTLIIIQENQFKGPFEVHVLAIKGPYFDNFLEKDYGLHPEL